MIFKCIDTTPFIVQKKVKIGEKKNYLKTFGFRLNPTPSPFGQCPKERRFFFDVFPNSPIMYSRLVCKDQKTQQNVKT